jgi:membrane-bound lytic murein transglycosylase D
LPPVHEFSGALGQPVVLVADPAFALLADASAAFAAGERALERGRIVAARQHFDTAIDLLLAAPGGARRDPRVAARFDDLLDRISALDLMMLGEAEGTGERPSEPAAIDALLDAEVFEGLQPLETTEATVRADMTRTPPAFPVDIHVKVLRYVERFQADLRPFIEDGLDRGQRYLPMIREVFEDEGVPTELSFMPLVESAFKPTALSRASARGIWQFVLGTGREFGLDRDWFVDERADPEKSTRAAARYLRGLHEVFGDWNLVLASYNGGPGRVQRALRRSGRSTFWDISSTTRYLPRETREYVPMVLAAIIIGRNPELYGFDVGPAASLTYETVSVPKAIDVRILAEWADVPVETIRDLNPELRRATTPTREYVVNLPVGTSATVQAELDTADPSLFVDFEIYTVRRGDTLSAIARQYRMTVADLRSVNQIRGSLIHPNQTLMIPGRTASALPSTRPAAVDTSAGPVIYRVRPGDTLTRIARRFDTTVDVLRQLNQLSGDRINVGDRLTVRR